MALAQNVVGHSLKVLVYSDQGETIREGSSPVMTIPFRVTHGGGDETEITIDKAIAFLPPREAVILEPTSQAISLKSTVPTDFALEQNAPNPFNPETQIEYRLPKDAHVRLDIYNILGERVVTLVDEYETAGARTVTWNGLDQNGLHVPSGIYFYSIRTGDFVATKKMVLAK